MSGTETICVLVVGIHSKVTQQTTLQTLFRLYPSRAESDGLAGLLRVALGSSGGVIPIALGILNRAPEVSSPDALQMFNHFGRWLVYKTVNQRRWIK
jgi:hypothetical protein